MEKYNIMIGQVGDVVWCDKLGFGKVVQKNADFPGAGDDSFFVKFYGKTRCGNWYYHSDSTLNGNRDDGTYLLFYVPHCLAKHIESLEREISEEKPIEHTPDYYKTAGIQPIEIMQKLMTPEQYEGFLWGNLIKYTYRYGHKDDKAGTARKIENYAKWLAELKEENEHGTD